MNNNKKILLFADWFAPGYKAGGPIRSCVNFVTQMQYDYQVYVFTSDRDLGSAIPYENIKTNEWYVQKGGASIYYCSPDKLTWKNIREQLAGIMPEFVYLNSMFSPKFTIYPLLISRLNKLKSSIVLAPRGMLRQSAVQFKPLKKKIFLKIFRILDFHRNIFFHAADDTEADDTRHYFGSYARVVTIPNFPANVSQEISVIKKKAGELSMIFIGRIHPIKNLDYLLKILKKVSTKIRLTIIGSIEDKPFWGKCQEIITTLPSNIKVEYMGEKPNYEISAITAGYHIFVLPTKGENFGHAIFEALAMSKPVLISDQTPWKNLQSSKAGWDLSLAHPEFFLQAIEQASAFCQEEYEEWCKSTRQFVNDYIDKLNIKEEYLKLFN